MKIRSDHTAGFVNMGIQQKLRNGLFKSKSISVITKPNTMINTSENLIKHNNNNKNITDQMKTSSLKKKSFLFKEQEKKIGFFRHVIF
jgi:hypothetical protein